MKHLIDIKHLNKEKILNIFSTANIIKANSAKMNRKILKGKTIANLFFENSTRTLISFELAAKKLGADIINFNVGKSSTQKGETLRDTTQTLQAMGVDIFIVRHPDNKICEQITSWLNPDVRLINAGDGNNQHPTQALLDTYTILQHKQNIESLKIAIIGDIKHSRVANSLLDCLHILGNQNTNLFGPQQLLPDTSKAIICKSFEQAIDHADIIVMLRIQKERLSQHSNLDLNNYHNNFGLNHDKLKTAKPHCIVMHPGPVNRGIEISSELADSSSSVILEQVQNGVLIRQAILSLLLA